MAPEAHQSYYEALKRKAETSLEALVTKIRKTDQSPDPAAQPRPLQMRHAMAQAVQNRRASAPTSSEHRAISRTKGMNGAPPTPPSSQSSFVIDLPTDSESDDEIEVIASRSIRSPPATINIRKSIKQELPDIQGASLGDFSLVMPRLASRPNMPTLSQTSPKSVPITPEHGASAASHSTTKDDAGPSRLPKESTNDKPAQPTSIASASANQTSSITEKESADESSTDVDDDEDGTSSNDDDTEIEEIEDDVVERQMQQLREAKQKHNALKARKLQAAEQKEAELKKEKEFKREAALKREADLKRLAEAQVKKETELKNRLRLKRAAELRARVDTKTERDLQKQGRVASAAHSESLFEDQDAAIQEVQVNESSPTDSATASDSESSSHLLPAGPHANRLKPASPRGSRALPLPNFSQTYKHNNASRNVIATVDLNQAAKLMKRHEPQPPALKPVIRPQTGLEQIRAQAHKDAELVRARGPPSHDPKTFAKIRALAQKDAADIKAQRPVSVLPLQALSSTTTAVTQAPQGVPSTAAESQDVPVPAEAASKYATDLELTSEGHRAAIGRVVGPDIFAAGRLAQYSDSRTNQPIGALDVTHEDWTIVDLRKEGMDWPEIQDVLEQKTGISRHSDWYYKRYKRMFMTFPTQVPPPLSSSASKDLSAQRKYGRRERRSKDEKIIPSDKITDDDWYLVELVQEGVEWADIHELWETRTGTPRGVDFYKYRYNRMAATFPDKLTPLKHLRIKLKNTCRPVHTEKDILSAMFRSPEASNEPIAMAKGVAQPARPTVGGKTISPAMAHYFLTRESSPDVSDESEDETIQDVEEEVITEPIPIDYSHYAYVVKRKTIPTGYNGDVDDLEWTTVTQATSNKKKANTLAMAEVFKQGQSSIGFVSSSFNLDKDTGMMTCERSGPGGTVLVKVSRFQRNHHDNIAPDDPYGFLPRTIYDVLVKTTVIKTFKERASVVPVKAQAADADGDIDMDDATDQEIDEEQSDNVVEHFNEDEDDADNMDDLFNEPEESAVTEDELGIQGEMAAEGESVIEGESATSEETESAIDTPPSTPATPQSAKRVRFAEEVQVREINSEDVQHYDNAEPDESAIVKLKSLDRTSPQDDEDDEDDHDEEEEEEEDAVDTPSTIAGNAALPPGSMHTTISTTSSITCADAGKIYTAINIANQDALDYIFKLQQTSEDASLRALLPGKSDKAIDRLSYINALAADRDQRLIELGLEEKLAREVVEGVEVPVLDIRDEENDEEDEEEGEKWTKMTTTKTVVEVWVEARMIEGPTNP